MKTLIIIFLVLVAATDSGFAQNLIAVQNGNTPKFFTDLTAAVTNAQDGDTIYIPGGSFSISDTIRKRLHFVGAGHHPVSSYTTSRTVLNGCSQMILTSGADYGSVTGIYFNYPTCYDGYPNIIFTRNVTGYSISRCFICKSINSYGILTNCTISECIIGDLFFNGSNQSVNNNIIMGTSIITASVIRNNVFTFSQPGYNAHSLVAYDCLIENNIIKPGTVSLLYCSNDIFHNNVNVGVNGISGTFQGSGNLLDDLALESIFAGYNPTTFNGDGIYDADLHLPVNSPFKNAGRDGTDIGIYGGAFPWKEGSIPFNPHFQKIQISPTTNAEGNLNVNIKVAAQER